MPTICCKVISSVCTPLLLSSSVTCSIVSIGASTCSVRSVSSFGLICSCGCWMVKGGNRIVVIVDDFDGGSSKGLVNANEICIHN